MYNATFWRDGELHTFSVLYGSWAMLKMTLSVSTCTILTDLIHLKRKSCCLWPSNCVNNLVFRITSSISRRRRQLEVDTCDFSIYIAAGAQCNKTILSDVLNMLVLYIFISSRVLFTHGPSDCAEKKKHSCGMSRDIFCIVGTCDSVIFTQL